MSTLPIQLSMFPENPSESTNSDTSNISWSYSKRSTFERCLRQYYYEYFGSKQRTARDEPSKGEIQFLSRLQSRYLRAGNIVHTVIQVTLRKAKQGELWDANRIAEWGVSILRKDRGYSRSDPDGTRPLVTKYPPVLLLDYHYRVKGVEAIYDELETRIFEALHIFATSSTFEEYRRSAQQTDSLIEKPFSLKVSNCRVSGKIDLAYRTQEAITIVDWKTGAEDGIGEDSLQMGIYALWGIGKFNCSSQEIRVCKAFLGSDCVVQFPCNLNTLRAVKVRISQDVERLASVQNYADDGIIDVFTPCYKELICRNCPYQRLCYGA